MPSKHDDLLDNLYDIAGVKRRPPAPPTPILYACPCGFVYLEPADLHIDMHLMAVPVKAREKALDVMRGIIEEEHRKECHHE